MPNRPLVVALDLFQTVFSLEPLRNELTAVGLPESALELWFARTVRDGLTLAATDTFRPFVEVAEGTLRGLLAEHERPDQGGRVANVMATFSKLPVHPDVPDAIQVLRNAEIRVVGLTNGSGENAKKLFERAGLAEQIERVVSIDDVRVWKPRAKVYRFAAREVGLEPDEVALVAVHAWDCHGAKQAGLTTAWVSWSQKVFNAVFDAPDVAAVSLVEACRALVKLPLREAARPA